MCAIKRQKLIHGPDLESVVDAVLEGEIVDAASLREYVRTEFSLDAKNAWLSNTWKNIQASRTCTDIVVMESEDAPPPPSMVQLASAMRGLMYHGTPVPTVAPSRCTKPEFDRNDWYLTNAADMERLAGEKRGVFDSRLCLVMLCTESRKYVTWCKRKHIETLVPAVNSGKVVLNKHATLAIQKGELYRAVKVLDDDLGQLLMRDLDDVLYMMEKTAGAYNTRHPHGFNVAPAHLVHRSLRQLGGDWNTLHIHAAWLDAEERRTAVLASVRKMALLSQKFSNILSATDTGTIFDAMKMKCDTQYANTEREFQLATRVCEKADIQTANMKTAVVNAIADCLLNNRAVPAKLHELNAHVPSDELRDVIAYVDNMLGRAPDMGVRNAMITLGMWDGHGPPPTLTKDAIKQAYASTHLSQHPDRTKQVNPAYNPEYISSARDMLDQLVSARLYQK